MIAEVAEQVVIKTAVPWPSFVTLSLTLLAVVGGVYRLTRREYNVYKTSVTNQNTKIVEERGWQVPARIGDGEWSYSRAVGNSKPGWLWWLWRAFRLSILEGRKRAATGSS